MPRQEIKSRLHSNKHKSEIEQEVNNNKSNLPSQLLSFKQKLLSGNGFIKYGSRLLEKNFITGSYLNNSNHNIEHISCFFLLYK